MFESNLESLQLTEVVFTMYGIYRPGEGYWTRVMTAIAAGLLAFIGGLWIYDIFRGFKFGSVEPIYVGAGGGLAVFAVTAFIIYWLVAVKPASVDFLVATEVEMKAVNWSTRREIFGSTWVVLFVTVLIALFVFVFDIVFSAGFAKIGVLDVGA